MAQTTTPKEQLARLTQLSVPPNNLVDKPSSGCVSLYVDGKWTSQKYDLRIGDYKENTRHTIPGAHARDSATWLSWCLPVGTVMTLMEHDLPVDPNKPVSDLRNCGRCVDLVGTGEVATANLIACNTNDCLSAFFWRKVDLTYGAIEFFEHGSYGGNRTTVFLSEWNSGQRYDLSYWWLNDKVTSMRWRSLVDRQTAEVSQHGDGSGKRYDNLTAWKDKKEIADLDDIDFNDGVSSFKWTAIAPRKEIIHPFKMTPDPSGGYRVYQGTAAGTNKTTEVQPVVVKVDEKKAQTVTITTSDQYVQGISASYSLSAGVDFISVEWSVSVSYSYTHTEESSTTETTALDLAVQQTVNAPAMTVWDAHLLVKVADISPTYYTTTATRWYDMPVSGGIADSTNNGWFKREENVGVTINGGLAFDVSSNINASPLAES